MPVLSVLLPKKFFEQNEFQNFFLELNLLFCFFSILAEANWFGWLTCVVDTYGLEIMQSLINIHYLVVSFFLDELLFVLGSNQGQEEKIFF